MHLYCADTECVQPSAKTACKSGTPPVAWGTLATRRARAVAAKGACGACAGGGGVLVSYVSLQ